MSASLLCGHFVKNVACFATLRLCYIYHDFLERLPGTTQLENDIFSPAGYQLVPLERPRVLHPLRGDEDETFQLPKYQQQAEAVRPCIKKAAALTQGSLMLFVWFPAMTPGLIALSHKNAKKSGSHRLR